MNKNSFGKNLKIYRKRLGITQSELSSLVGVSQVTIANYEKGCRFPKQIYLRNLAKVLEVSIDQLMGSSYENEKSMSVEDFSFDVLITFLMTQKLSESWDYLRQWKNAGRFSFNEFIYAVIIPVLNQIGDKWQNNEIGVSEEHLASEILRDLIFKFYIEEENTSQKQLEESKTWIGLCAPSEKHDLILYLFSLIMRLNGWNVFFIGKSIPLKDLKKMIETHKPSVLAFSITLNENRNGLEAYLEQLEGSSETLIVGGCGADADYCRNISSSIKYAESLEDAVNMLI